MKIKFLFWTSLVLFLAFTSYLLYLQSVICKIIETESSLILDLRYYYDFEAVKTFFSHLGKDGIVLYKHIIQIDMFYPIVYGLFGISLLYILSGNLQKRNRLFLLLLPCLVVTADYIENANSLALISAFEENRLNESAVKWAYPFTLAKHIIILVFGGAAAWLYWKRK
jgi:hypothetical protein